MSANSLSSRRIALYYPWLYLTSGAERTVLEIARRSRHRVTVYTNEYQPEATFPGLRDVDLRVMDRVPLERNIRSVGIAAARLLRQKLDLAGFDALLVVCEGLGDLMTLRHNEVPTFCLCLTPLRIVFDPVYRATYLSRQGALARLATLLASAAFRRIDRLAWRRYRRIFAISEEVRRRILAGGLAAESRVSVLHPGVELGLYSSSDTADRVFFVPGRIMWTKNLQLAIEAFRRFREATPDPAGWRLRIAGIVDRKSAPYLERLRTLAAGDPTIDFLIHPSEDQLLAEYRRCFATLFTAFNEDWGLVVIEAMASGKPVVAVNRGGPREIVRHEHDGLLAEPDAESFAAAMLRLVREPGLRDRLAANGPARASQFGWGPFVQELDDAIEDELRMPSTARSAGWAEAGA
jgi:glycosyltransferase involved in cell wall biosynthesis